MTNDEKQKLITALQSQGLKLVDRSRDILGRKGGAGPSDHKAIAIDGTTVMIPVYNDIAAASPYTLETFPELSLHKNGKKITLQNFSKQIPLRATTDIIAIPPEAPIQRT